jgi:hypothetical protein
MTAVKIIRLVHLVAYLIITSQLLFYLIILGNAMRTISLNSYFELRKVVDTLMNQRFRIIYYTCLGVSLLTAIFASVKPESPFFISTTVASICLVIDVYIAQRKNVPLNKLSNTYITKSADHEWQDVRIQWLKYIRYRGIFIVTGMIVLLLGLVWETR